MIFFFATCQTLKVLLIMRQMTKLIRAISVQSIVIILWMMLKSQLVLLRCKFAFIIFCEYAKQIQP